ncbi:hypothetical protein [Vibrio sp. YIC-376]|uniref:hypothetical protein n=1 Tax=Vibrio sp. YIC-376 TaxID=3136162 RepID=UPI00402A6AB5
MAYYYSLAIECGHEKEDAGLCEQHFKDFKIFHDGEVYDFITEQHILDDEGRPTFWIVIFSPQLPAYGISDGKTAELFTSIGNELLSHLSSFKNFRFSILGVESLGAIQFSEFDHDLVIDDSFVNIFNGLVISKEISSKLSRSDVFFDFGNNYLAIIPYKVELRKM